MTTEFSVSHQEETSPPLLDRRNFLWESGGGLGGIALAALLGGEAAAAEGVVGRHRLTRSDHSRRPERLRLPATSRLLLTVAFCSRRLPPQS